METNSVDSVAASVEEDVLIQSTAIEEKEKEVETETKVEVEEHVHEKIDKVRIDVLENILFV
jgi:hypothetical protein